MKQAEGYRAIPGTGIPGSFADPHPGGEGPLVAALTGAGIGVLTCDRNGRVVEANAPCRKLFGHDAEGEAFDALFHPEDARRLAAALLRCIATRAPFAIEVRAFDPGGAMRWCDLDISFASDVVTVLIRDATARHRAARALDESEDHHRTTIAFAPQISWTANAAGLIDQASPRWAEVTGMDAEEALGIGWLGALHPDDVSPTVAAWGAALAARVPVDVEYRLRAPDRGHRWFRARARPRLDAAGEVVRWYGTLEDIDDRRRAEQDLRESEERFRLAAEAARLGIWDYDAAHDRREWSDGFKDMLGLPRDTVPDTETALALVVPGDRHLLKQLIDAVGAGDSEHRFEVTLRIHRADTGAERWMQTSGWRIEAPNGLLARVLVTIRDVTEERTVAHRIRWAATHDAFTTLPNRAYFTEMFEAAIIRTAADAGRLALVLFDVDNLKATNDTIGHDAGDALLIAFAARLRARLGENAVLGRIGGDEFAAFIEMTGDETERSVIMRIDATLEALRDPLAYDGGALDCQATAGISFLPAHGNSAADLLKAADIALYAGKAARRGALSIFQPEMRANLETRAAMLAVARSAAREDRIVPHYQPKIRLADERIVGFEALLRWRHDTLGMQRPDTIAAAFEDMTTASLLGERMFDRICGDLVDWLDRGLAFGTVAFNLSTAEFRRDDLVDRRLARLHRDGIPPSMLELEITETVFLGRNADAVAATLSAFHREGIRIALDDFGTGYASLTHLQAFPVDTIKIDRSFVANVTRGAGDAAIVDAVIGLAKRLDMDVVAEGVETRAQADYLISRGCTYGQGYLFSQAVGSQVVGALLRR